MYDQVAARLAEACPKYIEAGKYRSINQSDTEVGKGDIAVSLPPINVDGLISTQDILLSPTSFNNQIIHIHLPFSPR